VPFHTNNTNNTNNWCHSIQITFYHSFAIKLFSFAGLPGRKNNLPAWDARRAWKSLSPKKDADDISCQSNYQVSPE